ncbi:unnamed protein product [Leuciscus chuanchicus]
MSEKKQTVDLGLLEEDDEFEEFPAEESLVGRLSSEVFVSEARRWSQREPPAGPAWACPLPTGPCSFALHSEGSHTEPEANLPSRTPPSKNDFSGFVAVRPKDIMS